MNRSKHYQEIITINNKIAPIYNNHNYLQREIAKRLIEQLDILNINAPNNILDIGSGTGILMQHLSRYNADFYSLDISHQMLLQDSSSVTKIRANAVTLPFVADSFDLIISNCCFNYLYHEDWQELFNQILYILKPNGTVLFSAYMPNFDIYDDFDLENLGDLIKLSGYSNIVITGENIAVNYNNDIDLFNDLNNWGFKITKQQLCNINKINNNITFNIVYAAAHKPGTISNRKTNTKFGTLKVSVN